MVEQLLNLQSKETAYTEVEVQLAHIPKKIASCEGKIQSERARIETARQELTDLELSQKSCEGDLKTAEDQLVKFKTQQSAVKKNDEYQALTQQIDGVTATIDTLESQDIELMMQIDTATSAFKEQEVLIQEDIAKIEAEIASLRERETGLKAEVAGLKSAYEAAKEAVEPSSLDAYNQARTVAKRLPYVVTLEDQKCGGCHLRVSNEIAEAAHEKPQFCGSCGRMVYYA